MAAREKHTHALSPKTSFLPSFVSDDTSMPPFCSPSSTSYGVSPLSTTFGHPQLSKLTRLHPVSLCHAGTEWSFQSSKPIRPLSCLKLFNGSHPFTIRFELLHQHIILHDLTSKHHLSFYLNIPRNAFPISSTSKCRPRTQVPCRPQIPGYPHLWTSALLCPLF